VTDLGIRVEVTQHPSSDSDQWLLHEIEDSYRDGEDENGRMGLLSGMGVKIRDIGGNKFIYWGLGGGSYVWMNDQKVIKIQYTDLQRTKPEPLEIIQAYLQKFPSTLPADLVLNSDHDKQWIKDEMTRRLWLCDKWVAYSQAGNVEISDLVQELADHLTIFLQYREKYHSISAKEELALIDDYMQADNKTALEGKLVEYKAWWVDHKNDSIILP
jgi:hypothetical protein